MLLHSISSTKKRKKDQLTHKGYKDTKDHWEIHFCCLNHSDFGALPISVKTDIIDIFPIDLGVLYIFKRFRPL